MVDDVMQIFPGCFFYKSMIFANCRVTFGTPCKLKLFFFRLLFLRNVAFFYLYLPLETTSLLVKCVTLVIAIETFRFIYSTIIFAFDSYSINVPFFKELKKNSYFCLLIFNVEDEKKEELLILIYLLQLINTLWVI